MCIRDSFGTVQIFLIQLAIKWPFSFLPHQTFVSALPGESTASEISLFCPMRYDCLINITRKKTFLTLWLIFHPAVHFSTACSKIAWNVGLLGEHRLGDAFSLFMPNKNQSNTVYYTLNIRRYKAKKKCSFKKRQKPNHKQCFYPKWIENRTEVIFWKPHMPNSNSSIDNVLLQTNTGSTSHFWLYKHS